MKTKEDFIELMTGLNRVVAEADETIAKAEGDKAVAVASTEVALKLAAKVLSRKEYMEVVDAYTG